MKIHTNFYDTTNAWNCHTYILKPGIHTTLLIPIFPRGSKLMRVKGRSKAKQKAKVLFLGTLALKLNALYDDDLQRRRERIVLRMSVLRAIVAYDLILNKMGTLVYQVEYL